MREPDYALEKAHNRYRSMWRDALLGTDSGAYTVALDPPSATGVTTHAGDVSAWLARWRRWAAQHPDVTLRTRTIRSLSQAEASPQPSDEPSGTTPFPGGTR